MSFRSVLLSLSTALTLGALIYLSMEVRAAPPEVPAQKIDEARQRSKRTRATPSPTNMPSDPWAPSKSEKAVRDEPRNEPIANDPPAQPDFETPTVEEQGNAKTGGSVPDLANDPRLEMSTAKDEANRMYDKQDYEGALARAQSVLDKEPGDVRMLRVAVSSACQLGDSDKAQTYWSQLPPHDQSQMNRRCQRFGITFKE